MAGRIAEAVGVVAVAGLVTGLLAGPVLRAAPERLFGQDSVGRHHDPFTMMTKWAGPITVGSSSQPLTDLAAAALVRAVNPVTAYNWLVLVSFPLSAGSAYLLARYLQIGGIGAWFAALAFAFSPFHFAHAAYHPHVAQTQWIPLYFLALWYCLDVGSVGAVAALTASALCVALSNFYGGFVVFVVTPAAVAGYTYFASERAGRSKRLAMTVLVLCAVGALGLVYAACFAADVVANRATFAFPRSDLFLYSAKWWSYLVPPVAQPMLGAAARRLWSAVGVRQGLLEQQVSLGWGVICLACVAMARWIRRGDRQGVPAATPVLAVVAAAALICSLSPERQIGAWTFVRPSALLYDALPMFRAYARFGVVVQLMAALLAGIAVDRLWRGRRRGAAIAGALLVACTVWEYLILPSSLGRDVLPTAAHRWVASQPAPIKALDCTPLTQESASITWLAGPRFVLLDGAVNDCAEPQLAQKLAAAGITHLLVRRSQDATWRRREARPEFTTVAAFPDAELFAVTTPRPSVYTAAMTGFFARERDDEWSWRWWGTEAWWTIVNTEHRPIDVSLDLQLSSFDHPRQLQVRLDGHPVAGFEVAVDRDVYRIGPLRVNAGEHVLLFHPGEPPGAVPDAAGGPRDWRRLSIAIGEWTWRVRSDTP